MQRRTFLKLSGMMTASSLLSGCRKGNEKLIPFLVSPEDETTPGLATRYASTCRQCPAGCGIVVKVSEGRAKKIEGNPLHPVNQGKLCSRGQAALQELYHPDRIRQPLKRSGNRGEGKFTAISWDEAMNLLQEKLHGLRQPEASGKLACMTPPLNGSLATLFERFMQAFEGSRHLAWDLLGTEWLKRGCADIFGDAVIPDYDIANTQYLLSFGADFAETHLSPVRYGHEFGAMRQARPTIRGRFTYVGPRLSMTAASADRWLACRPGSEGVLALGLARELMANKRFDQQQLEKAGLSVGELENLLNDYTLQKVSDTTGVEIEKLRATAEDLSTIRPALAMPGEAVAWQSNGLESTKAILLLNVLLGNIGRTGGVYLNADVPASRESTHRELRDFIDLARDNQFQMVMVYRSNPAYSVPAALDMQNALERIPFMVSFSGFLDETTRRADLILPTDADLETWGDIAPERGVREPVAGLLQPVVKPLHETRSIADILISLGRSLGQDTKQSIPWSSGIELLQSTYLKGNFPNPDRRAQSWNDLLQQGGVFGKQSGTARVRLVTRKLPEPMPAEFAGESTRFAYHLQVYPAPNLYDGRSAHLPWLQQLPDPMTTAVWDSWVEINPATARTLGIAHGERVEVVSETGRLELPAFVFPALHPDVVAIPVGQGHRGYGRYAEGTGVNPLQILATPKSEGDNLPAWGATRVSVRKLGRDGGLVTAGHHEGSYRRDIIGL